MQPKALAIVGMRRSGTSSVCIALNRLGVSFGAEEQCHAGNAFNEEGFWEHKALTGIHRTFRMSLNLIAVDCDPMPVDWRERPACEFFVSRAVRCLEEHFLPIAGPWAWKDPDASLALPFVYEVGQRLGFVPQLLICVRHPYDVARSELRRKNVPELESVGNWLAHTLGALAGSRGRRRHVSLFADFLADPRRALTPTVVALGIVPTDAEWEQAIASVRRDLVHSQSDHALLDRYPPLVKKVYDLCRLAASDPQSDIDDEIDRCSEEFQAYRQMTQRPALDEAVLGAMWERGLESRNTQIAYRPTGSWQMVRIETGALPASPVQLYLYPLPANVWIRRATWRHGEHATEGVVESGRSGNLREQFGLSCVSIIHGPDQVVVRTPAAKGPFALELEFLVESNNFVIGDTYRVLSEMCRK
ncbi:MAG: hypothetical protein P4L46_15960 [Fimbriimonas sp.]|nr:hypothetical protein [Fimbriimonas sp.]